MGIYFFNLIFFYNTFYMNIIKNISVLFLFFGIIILTIYITKSYGYKIDDKYQNRRKLSLHDIYQKYKSNRPNQMFNNMFENPSVWMGYTDDHSKNFNDKDYYGGNQLGLKALLKEQDKFKGDTYYSKDTAEEYGIRPSKNFGIDSFYGGSSSGFNTDLYSSVDDVNYNNLDN